MTALVTPTSTKGFEEIQRKWDNKHNKIVARVDPGAFYITAHDEYVFTRLGSCVAACIWDPLLGVGGLNHFLLPERELNEDWHELMSFSCRYGNFAMEQLINGILSLGGQKQRLRAKIFGGAQMGKETVLNVGRSNIEFVKNYLHMEGIEVESEDLGGGWPRKVLFHPNSGKVLLKRLPVSGIVEMEKEERVYLKGIVKEQTESKVELFD